MPNPNPSPETQPAPQVEAKPTLRGRIEKMNTEAELDILLQEVEGKKSGIEDIREVETQNALEKRMEEVGVQEATKERWKNLQQAINMNSESKGVADKAEKKFLANMIEKGGTWAIIGGIGLSIMAWLGFGKAKELLKSIKEKGYLRTVAEGAKKHPIFTAFVGALGLKVGYDSFKYLQNNAGPITEAIADKAKEAGVPGTEMAKTVADQLRNVVGKGFDMGISGTVKGICYILGGSYDEETGVVTIGNNVLKSPVLLAYQAGVRRRGTEALTGGATKNGYSRLLVESRFSAIMNQTTDAGLKASTANSYKKLMAKRGLELLNSPNLDAAGEAEVKRIMNALGPDMKLEGHELSKVQASAEDTRKHLEEIESGMKVQSAEEIKKFNQLNDELKNKMLEAEERIKRGDIVKGTEENYKKQVAEEVNKRMQEFHDDMAAKKMTLGMEYEGAINAVQSNIEGHVVHDLDGATQGKTGLSGGLEKTTKFAEKMGYKMTKIPGAKYALRGIIGYSFLPLILEGGAALRSGEKGEAAKQAFILDATDAGIGFIPVVGELNDFRAAIMGTDLNGRELDTWSRMTSGAMGTLGTASIALGFFTGGATIVGFKALRGVLATRKAVKAARLAEAGVTSASVTAKGVKAIEAASDSAKAVDKMYEITKTQKIARTGLNVVRNAQRGMQIYTYGALGYSMISGVTEVYNSAEGMVGFAQQKALGGINAAEEFVNNKMPATP